MKRFFALWLVLALMFSLAACGGGKDKTPTNTGDLQSDQARQPGDQSAENGKDAPSDATGTEEDFTVPEMDAAKRTTDLKITTMKTKKKLYAPGEAITVTLKWSGTPDSGAWVGIIPADVPHGDEYVNDEADVAYIYLSGNEGDQFVFDDELAEELAPGMYTLRVNEDDSGGAELAWCAFAVSGVAREDASTAGEVVDFAVGIEGVPAEWQKGIGDPILGFEVSADGSDFTAGYLQKFGKVSEEDFAAYIAYFDTLTYIEKLDGVYNCDWGQFQFANNAEYAEMTISWFVK